MNKVKEKKKKNTKEEKTLDLDNEIIIGIKPLPKPTISKKKKAASSKKNTREVNKRREKRKENRISGIEKDKENHTSGTKKEEPIRNKKGNKKKNLVNRKKKEKRKEAELEEFELKLGIEDESVKRKNSKKLAKRKPKMTQKQQEMAKKKRKKVFRVIKWTSLAVLLIGGGIYFLLSPFFNVKSILVAGNEKISSEELVSLSGIQLEENTFKISNKKVEQAIKENAYIDSVKLKRKLPDVVEIQVVERKPAYMIMIGNAYMYVNTQGYLLEVSKEALKLPIIIGFLTPEEDIQVGNRLCEEDLHRFSSVIQIMDSANNNEIGSLITKINISDKQDYVLELKSEKKTVHVGDTSNLSTKMLYVKEVLEKEKKHEGDIFVNIDLSNKGAIFREKV